MMEGKKKGAGALGCGHEPGEAAIGPSTPARVLEAISFALVIAAALVAAYPFAADFAGQVAAEQEFSQAVSSARMLRAAELPACREDVRSAHGDGRAVAHEGQAKVASLSSDEFAKAWVRGDAKARVHGDARARVHDDASAQVRAAPAAQGCTSYGAHALQVRAAPAASGTSSEAVDAQAAIPDAARAAESERTDAQAAEAGSGVEAQASVISSGSNSKPATVLCWLEIPRLSLKVPVYEGSSDAQVVKDLLLEGAVHVYGTSQPGGGSSTHAGIEGHSGMGNARMFDEIDKLQAGDTFSLWVDGEQLTYEVYASELVAPGDVADKIRVERGKDLTTLVTCRPIGENTNRLLVHAKRVANDGSGSSKASTPRTGDLLTSPRFLMFAAAIALLAAAVASLALAKRPKRSRQGFQAGGADSWQGGSSRSGESASIKRRRP